MTIDEILSAPKHITRRKKIALIQDQRHWRTDIPIECDLLPYKMTMFIRKLVEIEEDFSIGLRLDQACDPFVFAVVLVRFQGPHGAQSVLRSGLDMHNSYHIHRYSDEDLRLHRKNASFKCSSDFESFDQALIKFLSYCNIDDPYDIFREERERCNQLQMHLGIQPTWGD